MHINDPGEASRTAPFVHRHPSPAALVRTDKGAAELRPGVRTLGQRERGVLLLANGHKAIGDFAGLYDGDGQRIAADLVQAGYLSTVSKPSPANSPPAPAAPAPAGDGFVGKRSLATTRMFLFDLCERMFARRDPALGAQFRAALREAKDRDAMLAAARDMIAEIERVAGHERADAISERIAMIIPEG